MTFITTPFMRSFVGFDQLFNELENTATIKDSTYPAYNIEKIGDEKRLTDWECLMLTEFKSAICKVYFEQLCKTQVSGL